MNVVKCASCGADIYMGPDRLRRLKDSGAIFYCLAGHENVFRPSEAKKLREQVERLQASLRAKEIDVDRAYRQAGMWRCPFCDDEHRLRTRGGMQRHIVAKHRDAFGPKLLVADLPPHPLSVRGGAA